METENTPLADDLASGQQIGDYLIGDLLYQGRSTMTWSAIQVSVQRDVAICHLYGSPRNEEAATEAFMADTRTKATVDHPLISSVLEAIHEGGQCFFAREKLSGKTIQQCRAEGLNIAPLQVACIIRDVADIFRALEHQGVATIPLTEEDIVIDDLFQCRLVNQAVTGEVNGEVAIQDKKMLAGSLRDLLMHDQPGATRLNSLLDYMQEGHGGESLSWEKIHELADGVERQLAEPKENNYALSKTTPVGPGNASMVTKILSVAGIIAIIGGLIYFISNRKKVPTERELDVVVEIPNGSYPGPMGAPVTLSNFAIDAHEVTIGEYAKFLKALSVLSTEQRKVYQHEEQPTDKTEHFPDDWDNLYAAATSGGTWNDMSVDLNYPVVGVDWWDAYAYAEWKGCRLPTRNEWYAAFSAGTPSDGLNGSGWMPVDEAEKTSHGLYGMAGNVSEWTLERSFDPADPSQPARFIICGASYLNLKYGARAFEWMTERGIRRSDLGFRTGTTVPKTE